nr:13517_t:CDS:2 [Entrophospora candida]
MVENLNNINEVVKHTSLKETKHEVEVKLVDEDEPLLSVATFEQLNLPQNMIGQSQSGTGTLFDTSRELAHQIMTEVRKMGKYTSVVTAEAIRESQHRVTKTRLGEFHGVQLIVGTPGTADNMLDQQGLGDQSIRIKKFAPNVNEFSLKVEELSVISIKQFYVDCTNDDHKVIVLDVLDKLYSLLTISQSIIFVQKRETADRIARLITERNRRVINLHIGLSTIERDQVMDDFQSGSAKVLITTNVLAHGIDVLQVNLVINYDLPVDYSGRNPDYETYLHTSYRPCW